MAKNENVKVTPVNEEAIDVTPTAEYVDTDSDNLPAVVDTEYGAAVIVSPTPTVADVFTQGLQMFSTLVPDGTPETEIKLFNALNDNDGAVKDQLNVVLEVENILAFPVQLVSEETGELIDTFRVVLITKDGKTYGGVGNGLRSSVQKLLAIRPAPWNPAIKLTPIMKQTKRGYTCILRMIP